MAKKKTTKIESTSLFDKSGTKSTHSQRRRSLFIPRLLREEAENKYHQGTEQDKAYTIIEHWADLESQGHLARKETSLDAEFLHEIFGDALGYRTVTNSPSDYNLDRAFTIPGTGLVDGALGHFSSNRSVTPIAVIELKSADVNLDRDKSNGRTPVQQCWDYLNALPNCPWGIVSNFVNTRLYHRDKTPHAYEEFTLQGMRDLRRFREFYCLFHRRGLLDESLGKPPRAQILLTLTDQRQREVGDELYRDYNAERHNLIAHLHEDRSFDLDLAIRITQKILDRIIFIAFCEDRELLPSDAIEKAFNDVPPYARVTNPKWQNFLNLFRAVDEGHAKIGLEHGYNGGLFRHDPDVDDLQLDDDWTNFFRQISAYDFRDEVNVDVLGHIFERSITELEKMRVGGLFANNGSSTQPQSAMKKSAERKRFGVFYTPPDFTNFIVQQTVGSVIQERLDDIALNHKGNPKSKAPLERSSDHIRECINAIKDINICDPACGSGAFLIAAYDLLEDHYVALTNDLELAGETQEATLLREDFPNRILTDNLYGVDVSEEAIEITQLALWIRSARQGKTLSDLSTNIVCGNSLVSDPGVHHRAIAFDSTFPDVFNRPQRGFDCVIGNPPWERVKLQEREFFAFASPKIAGAVSAATRRKMITKLEKSDPDLFARYKATGLGAEKMLTYARKSGAFPLTGKGDINYYALFAERSRAIVGEHGLVGLLVPSGIASDNTTKAFFNALTDNQSLRLLYDFENKKRIFPDVDGRFKFCTLVFSGKKRMCESTDFVFFAHEMDDLKDVDRHITLTAKDIKLLNPNTRTCPIFRSQRDAKLTKAIYRRVPILIDESRKSGGNPWGVKFLRMFDQTNDAELFHTADQLKKLKYKRDGALWRKGKKTFLPLYEAKMVQMYDHRAAGVVVDETNWMRQGQTESTSLVSYQNPEFTVKPRWWVAADKVAENLSDKETGFRFVFKDVTSPTNERTMIASYIPKVGVVNSAPLIQFDDAISPRQQSCLLGNINAFVYDFVTRQKVGGLHLNFFIVKQLPTLSPDTYVDPCPWNKKKTLESWISERVLKLTCTANDMIPLAKAAGFKKKIHKYKLDERAELMAELDAAYFNLYGVSRDDTAYILSTFSGVQRKDNAATGTNRTTQLILSKYDEYADQS